MLESSAHASLLVVTQKADTSVPAVLVTSRKALRLLGPRTVLVGRLCIGFEHDMRVKCQALEKIVPVKQRNTQNSFILMLLLVREEADDSNENDNNNNDDFCPQALCFVTKK
jgi:hypothetical protein